MDISEQIADEELLLEVRDLVLHERLEVRVREPRPIEIENQEGDLIADSGHGLGWEVGAGVAIGVGEKGSLTPGPRYRSLSRDLEFDGVEVPVDLRYVTAELGFAWHL